MNNLPVLRALRIKKLFGKHDLSIDFNKLTVIVGKNGMGKTTLLKIIRDLITDKDTIRYPDICESIELDFYDGNAICYGIVNDALVNSVTNIESPEFNGLIEDKTINEIINNIEGAENLLIEDKLKIAKGFFQTILKSEVFYKQASGFFLEKLKERKDQVFRNNWYILKLKNDVNLRYISTVNISANAGNRIDLGNSVDKNLLDLAIYEELRILFKNASALVKSQFESQLNIFLTESGKMVKQVHGEWVFITSATQSLKLEQLSSGERQLVYILATAANTCGKPTLFLMDEPEVSLHLSWQEKIIDSIMKINPQMQIIAVTHSPGIIMNGHMDAYVEMKDIMEENEIG